MKRLSGITASQLAKICGVSQGTVDRAIHGRGEINSKTRERILAAAKEYGYEKPLSAAKSEGTLLIGVVLFDLYNAFFSKLAMSLTEAARAAGYSVIFQFSNKNPDAERRALDYFNYIGTDGIILFPIGNDSAEYTEYLRSFKRKIITVGNELNGIDYIGIDDEEAMYDLCTEMLRECAESVAYFAPILKSRLHSKNAQLLRLRGYERAVGECGREPIIITEAEWISRGLGGIICSTDHYLLQVRAHLGGDSAVRLAGFDNTDALKSICGNALTVEYSTDRIAEECINCISGKAFVRRIGHSIIKNCP